MVLSAPTFGELLRQLRRRVGLTQGELALVVGFSVAQISRLEKDERLPDLAMLVEKFLPALSLEDEPRLAQRLLELAATARGERVPTAVIAQREVRTMVQEEVVESHAYLPLLPLPLIGREQDLAASSKRLMAAPGRLLTLIGPPGVGKTQLALAIAGKLYHLFSDGVQFVPLAAVTDPDHVPSAILLSLGLADHERKSPRSRLLEQLRRKNLLLVLDNFEQLSTAAPVVSELLGECPGLRILVTSQEPLRLRIEQRQRVQPLDLAAAIELFFQRAQAIHEEFATDATQAALVAEICLRLDCLPLAIELIAAQSELFSAAQLLTRLQDHALDLLADGPRDLPAHQRTLRNAIHRSYMLLTDEWQRLFRTLGVFTGGATLAAVAAVLDNPTNPTEENLGLVQEQLRTLLRKSLVQHSETDRFSLLTTLSAYAQEQLVATGEEVACRQRHAHYYLALAQTAAQQLQGKAKKPGLDQLAAEHDNLRAALAWLLIHEPATALDLVVALLEFWQTRGYDTEARRWIDQVLQANPLPTSARAMTLVAAGIFARRQANYVLAHDYLAESIALYQTLSEPAGLAAALREDGWLEYDLHQKASAIDRFYASLALYRQVDERERIAHLLLCLVHVMNDQPDYQTEQQAYLAESIALFRELEQTEGMVQALQQQGEWELATGNYRAAEAHFHEALAYWRQIDAKLNIAWGVALVGEAAALQGKLAIAERCYAEAYQIFETMGNKDGCAILLYHIAEVARCQSRYDQAWAHYRESLALCQLLQNRHVTARCLAGLGQVAQAQLPTAATLLCAAEAMFTALPPFLPPAAQTAFTEALVAVRQQLDEATFAHCQLGGQVTTIDEVITLVDLAAAKR